VSFSSRAQFQSKLEGVASALRRVLLSARLSNVGTLPDAVSAEAGLKAAADDLKARADRVNANLKELDMIIAPSWRVPEPAATQLRSARAQLVSTREAFKAGDISKAESNISELVRDLRTAVEKTARSYRQAYNEFIADVTNVGSLLLPRSKTAFDAAVTQLSFLGRAIADVSPTDDVAKPNSILDAITQADSAAESLLGELRNLIIQTFAVLDELLAGVALPNPHEWALSNEASRTFAKSLPDVMRDLANCSPDMQRKAFALKNQWRAALLAQAKPQGLISLFDHGKYDEAAQLVASALKTATQEEHEAREFDLLCRPQCRIEAGPHGFLVLCGIIWGRSRDFSMNRTLFRRISSRR